jgi:hypothetical protein
MFDLSIDACGWYKTMQKEKFPKSPSVLVAAPFFYKDAEFFCPHIKSWRNFSYENLKFCIVEDDIRTKSFAVFHPFHIKLRKTKYVKKPSDLVIFTLDRGNYTNRWEPLTRAQNKIRKFFLEKDFDFLFINEFTRSAPPHIIEDLLGHNKKVIAAVYKHSSPRFSEYYTVWDFDKDKNSFVLTRYRHIDKIKQPTRVNGIGFGAILIHRSILEEINGFHSLTYGADTYFCEDLKEKKIPVYAAPIIVKNRKVERYNRLKSSIDKRLIWFAKNRVKFTTWRIMNRLPRPFA